MLTLSAELLSQLSGKKSEELQSLLFEGEGEDATLKEDAPQVFVDAVVEKFKSVELDRSKNASNKAVLKRVKQVEAALSPILQTYKVSPGETIEATLEDLSGVLKQIGKGEGQTKPKPQNLTKDDLVKLPVYQELLDEALAPLRSERDEWKNKHENYVASQSRAEELSLIKKATFKYLSKEKALFSSNPDKQIERFLRGVGTDHIFIEGEGDNRKIVLKDKDGNPLRDSSSNPIDYESWVNREWTEAGYLFNEAPPGSSSVGGRRDGEQGSGAKVVITSEKQYQDLLKSETDPIKKAEIHEAFALYTRKKG